MEKYKYLSSYILATVICDLNVKFCDRFLSPNRPFTRTVDQMTQAGRSGKQNIAEGCSLESLESYIKLLGVAFGSFKELVCDYEDFLRQKGFSIWPKDDKRVRVFREFRAVWVKPNIPNTPNLPNNPEEAANLLLTLCQMETFLLNKQIEALKKKFVETGGFRENLFKKRLDYRNKKQ